MTGNKVSVLFVFAVLLVSFVSQPSDGAFGFIPSSQYRKPPGKRAVVEQSWVSRQVTEAKLILQILLVQIT
jgi:hypothetical protein